MHGEHVGVEMRLLIACEVAVEVLGIALAALDLPARHSEIADRGAKNALHVGAWVAGHEIGHGDLQPQFHRVGGTIGENLPDAVRQHVALPVRQHEHRAHDEVVVRRVELWRAELD